MKRILGLQNPFSGRKKKTYFHIYVCMAVLLFVGAAISLSVGSADIGIVGSIKLALSGIPGIGSLVDISV